MFLVSGCIVSPSGDSFTGVSSDEKSADQVSSELESEESEPESFFVSVESVSTSSAVVINSSIPLVTPSVSHSGTASGTLSSAATLSPSIVPADDLSQDWSGLSGRNNGGITTTGLYTWDDNPSQHAFWKACGVTTLQFCDRGWWFNASSGDLEAYLQRMKSGIRSAQKSGFKVYVILFSNISQYMGPNATEPTGLGVKFHPDDTEKLNSRLYYIGKTVEILKEADGFTFFAGDPGGIPNSLGEGSAEDYTAMALKVREVVREKAPGANFNLNPWAVTMFETPNVSAMTVAFWQKEAEIGRSIIASDDLAGPDIGIEIPGHDYYRPLALRLYVQTNKIPERMFPQKSDIDSLYVRQTKRVWAWPYFLLDEADDGDKGSNGTYLPQFETRYIHSYVSAMRILGENGIIGSWSYAGYQSKMMNTYAFARMVNDVSATPESVIDEFCCFISEPQTRKTLAEIIKFIENHSNFESKLPDKYKLGKMSTTVTSAAQALTLLDTVKENSANKFPLPLGPDEYLELLKQRLEMMIG
jgi:hypothetical protein